MSQLELCCGLCGHDIPSDDARVEATCSKAECATTSYHLSCIEEYVQRNFRSGMCKTRALHRAQVVARLKPWKELESGLRCPAGTYTLSRTWTEESEKQLLARTGKLHHSACAGKVVSAQLADAPQSKKKAKAAAAPAPAPAPFVPKSKRGGGGAAAAAPKPRAAPAHAQPRPNALAGPRLVRAAPAPAAAPTSLPTPPLRTSRPRAEAGSAMSLAKAKAFLGIGSDDEDERDAGGGGQQQQAQASRAELIAKLLSPPTPQAGAAAPEPAAQPADADAAMHQDSAGEATASQEASSPAPLEDADDTGASTERISRRGVLKNATTITLFDASAPAAWDGQPLSEGEIEVAVREGLLPADFRTEVCAGAAYSGATGGCRRGKLCPQAHSPAEQRVEAAVALGLLPYDFHTLLCENVATGRCALPAHACPHAHSPADLRAGVSSALGRVPLGYKTTPCGMAAAGLLCPAGLQCPHFHAPSEARREAAVQCGTQGATYKLTLCARHAAGACPNGLLCTAAHGAFDLRLGSLYASGLLPPGYKAMACREWALSKQCRMGTSCFYAHGPQDRLPHVDVAATLCPIFKETGHCSEACTFAHSVDELELSEERMAQVEAFARAFNIASGKQPRPPPGEPADGSQSSGGAAATPSAALSEAALSRTSSTSSAQPAFAPASARDRDWGFAAAKAGASVGTASSPGPASSAAAPPSRSGQRKKAPAKVASSIAESTSQGFNYEKYRQAAAAKEAAGGGGGGGGSRRGPGPGLRFPGGRRPKSLLQCGHYRDMGRCPIVNCEYAHGEAEQREREAAWAEGERRAEAERRAAAAAKRRADKEAAEREKAQQAAMLQEFGFEGDVRMDELAPGRAFGGGADLDAAFERISEAAVGLMRRHKLEMCGLQLMELGFDDDDARKAAAAGGGDVAAAVAVAVEGGPAPGALTEAPVDISRELGVLLASASRLGLSPEDVDVEVAIAGGDWGRAARELPHRRAAQALPQDEDDLLAAEPAAPQPPPPPSSSPTAAVPQAEWVDAGGQADWGAAAGNDGGGWDPVPEAPLNEQSPYGAGFEHTPNVAAFAAPTWEPAPAEEPPILGGDGDGDEMADLLAMLGVGS